MHLAHLKRLREVGQQVLDEKLSIGFGQWECDTYCCLGGWYNRLADLGLDFVVVDDVDMIDGGLIDGASALNAHFGIDSDQGMVLWNSVLRAGNGPKDVGNYPGKQAYIELQSRMSYLDTLIAKAGMPDSVKDIFKEEAPCLTTENA